ncbi:LCP family protein [bacterium]|nr:LCP family protein [bacterium]
MSRAKQDVDQAQDTGAAGETAHGHTQAENGNGNPPGHLHPASMTARKLRAMNAALMASEQARDSMDEDDIPDVGSGRIGTISEAASRLREAGVIPPTQPMAQPGVLRGPAVPQRRRRPAHQRRSFWVTIMAFIVLLGLPFAWWYFSPMLDPVTGKLGKRGDQIPDLPRLFIDPQKALLNAFDGQSEVQFLLVGLDHVPPTKRDPNPIHRSDSVIMVRANLENKEVRMLSIPRDGWVMHIGSEGEELGWDKLAHSYANGTEDNPDNPEGGIRRTKMTVEHLMGVPVDYYMIIEIDGFQKIIDELGGITVDVEKRMKYRDRAGGLNIDLQPGVQLLNGEQAMGYARFRHDAVGDIGRMARQQQVIKAIITELQKPENLPKLPVLGQLLGKALKTNLRMDQMLALVNQSKKFELSKIQSMTLPSYWNREPGHRIDLPGADGGMDAQAIFDRDVEASREFILNTQPPPPPPLEGEAADGTTPDSGASQEFVGGSALEDSQTDSTDAASETPDSDRVRNPCAGD